jgi:hypothetical protein
MINVDMTIVGFFDDVKHMHIVVPDNRPTVKNALSAVRDTECGGEYFTFEETVASNHRFWGKFATRTCSSSQDLRSVNFLTRHQTERLFDASLCNGRVWSFGVLRKIGNKKFLVPNLEDVNYDQFRIVDGDQIYWSLVTVVRPVLSLTLDPTDKHTPIAV